MKKKRLNVTIQQNNTKMINFHGVAKENIKERLQIPNHPCRILIIGGSWSGKTNLLFNLISHQQDIGKIYLYDKDSYETKYQLITSKKYSTFSKHLNDSKAFIKYQNDMDDIYKNNEKKQSNKKRKILIAL